MTRARAASPESGRAPPRRRGWLLLATALALPVPRTAFADPALTVDDAYERLGIERAEVPMSDPALGVEDARTLEALLRLADEGVALNVSTGAWLRSQGREGLHPAAHAERSGRLQAQLAAIPAPERLLAVRQLLGEVLHLQEEFVTEWADALAAGKPFDSQLTSENGYHEGLHRSHRKLLQAFGELRALYPDAREETQQVFRHRLRALDFL